jgi:hypothetical protein
MEAHRFHPLLFGCTTIAMIRREKGDEFVLITQHDHALLAAKLARHVGNAQFVPPSPFDSVVMAIGQHDCGWPIHDDHPTINSSGQPRHVFESDCDIALKVWPASVDRVAAQDPYAGLLVSLHSMALATYAVAHQGDELSEKSRLELFRFNRFLHLQIEKQEAIRISLAMRTDMPLRGGLANPGRANDEDLLLYNFHLLQFLDQLSLNLCFDRMVFGTARPVLPKPGIEPVEIRIDRERENVMRVDPWPFDVERIDLQITARRIPARVYANDADLDRVYHATPEEKLNLTVQVWHAR